MEYSIMTRRDLDVINILFSNKEPMAVTEMIKKKWDMIQSTATGVLRKLLQLEYVEVVGFAKIGKVPSRTYQPTAKGREAAEEYMLNEYSRIKDAISVDKLCQLLKERYGKQETGAAALDK